MNDSNKTKPVHTIRLGRIKATIWANENSQGMMHNVQISRIYKDGDSWKETGSFNREDLLLVAKLSDQAHSWIYENSA